mmetsp:Transcript_8378/g.14890  ORF Transcript_8378/g.14890 Transcript_8378/m.14890 type:complete len:207 (-) Transcript_8378:1274-1894(-)
MMSIDGGVPPNARQDQKPGEAQEGANEGSKVVVVDREAAHLFPAEQSNLVFHGLLPGVALYDTNPEEDLPERCDALVHALLQLEHRVAQTSTHGQGEENHRNSNCCSAKSCQSQATPKKNHEDEDTDGRVYKHAQLLIAALEVGVDIVVDERHKISLGHGNSSICRLEHFFIMAFFLDHKLRTRHPLSFAKECNGQAAAESLVKLT